MKAHQKAEIRKGILRNEALESIIKIALENEIEVTAYHIGEYDEKKVKSVDDVDFQMLATLSINL